MEWYYANESDQQISFAEQDFKGLIDKGAIKSDTLVWNSSMTDWKEASLVQPALFGSQGSQVSSSPTPNLSAQGPVAGPVPGQAPAGQAPPVAYYPPSQTDGLALASMICGIFAVLMICGYGIGIFPGIAAIICGSKSKKNIANGGPPGGDGMATAGLVMGWVGSAISLLFLLFLIGMIVFSIATTATMDIPSVEP